MRTATSQAASADNVTEIANVPLAGVGVAAIRLAEVLPALEQYPDILSSLSPPDSAFNTYRIWDGQQYVDPPEPVYRHGNRYVGRAGLYRVTPNNAATGAFASYLFFDAPQQRFLKGEVQGLRFIARSTALRPDGLRPQGRWNPDTSQLFTPDRERWPVLYERALVLASGLLPGRADNPDWLVYECISRELASLLAGKLNVELTEIKSPLTVAEPVAAMDPEGRGTTEPATAEVSEGSSPDVPEDSCAERTEPGSDPETPAQESKVSSDEPHREYWSSGDE